MKITSKIPHYKPVKPNSTWRKPIAAIWIKLPQNRLYLKIKYINKNRIIFRMALLAICQAKELYHINNHYKIIIKTNIRKVTFTHKKTIRHNFQTTESAWTILIKIIWYKVDKNKKIMFNHNLIYNKVI